MTKIAIVPNAAGTGTFTIEAPNSNSNRTLTLPDAAGEIYGQGNILGTVSQSAGVPTGAIIEQGTNANGRYVKYADGTQIAFIYGTESRTASGVTTTALTLPVTFVDASVGSSAGGDNIYCALATLDSGVPATAVNITVGGFTTTGLNVRTDRTNATACLYSVFIIGRWF
jgi:hypothetical protein